MSDGGDQLTGKGLADAYGSHHLVDSSTSIMQDREAASQVKVWYCRSSQ